jgi:hypothetical protein
MKIQVTHEDIATSYLHLNANKSNLGLCCPIALALRKHFKFATVTEKGAAVWPHGEQVPMRSVQLPNVAKEFINRFDRGEKVDPLEFEIEVPS